MASQGTTNNPLWLAIHQTPIIDNHAHPLLKPSSLTKYPFLTIATEAHGPALPSSRQSLAHLRAVKQLSRVLGCPPTWEAVEAAVQERRRTDYEAWTRTCLEGIECVLVDDGLDGRSDVHGYAYFDGFARGKSKRIVRIEHFAAEIIDRCCMEQEDATDALLSFTDEFKQTVRDAITDPEVVGFKSVICYRTGLGIPSIADASLMETAFKQIHSERRAPGATSFTRVDHKGLNEFLVHILAQEIRASKQVAKKPIQFHTGLGDNDITLTKSSPAHLQSFIEAYPDVPMVLLHSGYPYARDMGYLAAMYANVYADIGEIFPFLSRGGQEGVVRQILELCPWSKVLWSTDGHWFPETYFLAVVQMREVLWTVLSDFVSKGDLYTAQAVTLVEDILFHNSNRLYNLGMTFKLLPKVPENSTAGQGSQIAGKAPSEVLSKFLGGINEPKFLRIYWHDMTGMCRTRAVPIRRVLSLLQAGEELSFGIATAALGILQNDFPAEGVSASGEYKFHPDFATLRHGPRKGHISMRGDFRNTDGSAVPLCPRTVLKSVLEKARAQGLTFELGFEIEFLLMNRGTEKKFEPLVTDGHGWSVAHAMEHDAANDVVEAAFAQLEEAGIYIEMVHAESANGQYEIILPRADALQAVDTLLHARDIISAAATAKGYRMTLHPKPFPMACGTASHVHMSISSENGNEISTYGPFYAGILKHLRALLAFTYATSASYERARDGFWAGGTYVAWGTQNRETPLRKIEESHWELKALDGTANMYLAMAAVLGAGVLGVQKSDDLSKWGDCGFEAAAGMTEERRRELGIKERLPGSLDEAMGELKKDAKLIGIMGTELVERYIAVKKKEEELLSGMEEEERKVWMMERY